MLPLFLFLLPLFYWKYFWLDKQLHWGPDGWMHRAASSRHTSGQEKIAWVPHTKAVKSVKLLTSDFSAWSCCMWSDALICNWMTKSSSHPYLLSNWRKTLQCKNSLWFFCVILHLWKGIFYHCIALWHIFISTELQNMRCTPRLCTRIYRWNWRLKREFILHLC